MSEGSSPHSEFDVEAGLAVGDYRTGSERETRGLLVDACFEIRRLVEQQEVWRQNLAAYQRTILELKEQLETARVWEHTARANGEDYRRLKEQYENTTEELAARDQEIVTLTGGYHMLEEQLEAAQAELKEARQVIVLALSGVGWGDWNSDGKGGKFEDRARAALVSNPARCPDCGAGRTEEHGLGCPSGPSPMAGETMRSVSAQAGVSNQDRDPAKRPA